MASNGILQTIGDFMKTAFSLLICISVTTFAMRQAPVRRMGTRPAAAAPAQAPIRAQFLSNDHKWCLQEIAANRYEKFTPEVREQMIRVLVTLPCHNKDNFAYNNALMTLARKSAYLGNLNEELPLAKLLVEAGADPKYSVKVQQNDCFGSDDAVPAHAPYHYNTETISSWATGDFQHLVSKY